MQQEIERWTNMANDERRHAQWLRDHGYNPNVALACEVRAEKWEASARELMRVRDHGRRSA